MKLTFLGTGTSQGVPVIGIDDPVCKSTDTKDKRLRTSAIVEWNGLKILIDCSADFRQQMLENNFSKIDAILFTHEHADHTAGFDDIRPICIEYGAMPIYAMPRVMDNLKRRFDYIFATENRYEGAPSVSPHIISEYTPFFIDNNEITPLLIEHGKLPILGYKLNNLAYITDAKQLPKKTLDAIQNIDTLVINALRIKPHPTHLNLEEALKTIEQINPQKAYLTHISFQLGFHQEVQKRLPDNVFLAYDGLQIDV